MPGVLEDAVEPLRAVAREVVLPPGHGGQCLVDLGTQLGDRRGIEEVPDDDAAVAFGDGDRILDRRGRVEGGQSSHGYAFPTLVDAGLAHFWSTTSSACAV